jgi:hypothetical protein
VLSADSKETARRLVSNRRSVRGSIMRSQALDARKSLKRLENVNINLLKETSNGQPLEVFDSIDLRGMLQGKGIDIRGRGMIDLVVDPETFPSTL